jgi:hypothetical protein
MGPVARRLDRVGLVAVSDARRESPVDTGRLRASIHHRRGVDAQGVFVDIGSNVEYAVFVEATHPRKRGFIRRAVVKAVRNVR